MSLRESILEEMELVVLGKIKAERQRDAYAETLRQTLVLLDTTPSIERPSVLADIIRERHPELAEGK